MTLCIAATCQLDELPCQILCTDLAGSRGDVIAEDSEKMRDLGTSHVLLAGSNSYAVELLGACEIAIQKFRAGSDVIAMTQLLDSLREGVRVRKRAIQNAYMSPRYGISFEEFFHHGKTSFTEGHYLQIWSELNGLDLQAELIITSFSDDESVLIHVDRNGEVKWVDGYAMIGSGTRIANAFMRQREYSEDMPFDECLYRVVEAKIAAERDPYVGQATDLAVHTKNKEFQIDEKYLRGVLEKTDKRLRTVPPIRWDRSLLAEVQD